jgi:hypothetical protein
MNVDFRITEALNALCFGLQGPEKRVVPFVDYCCGPQAYRCRQHVETCLQHLIGRGPGDPIDPTSISLPDRGRHGQR